MATIIVTRRIPGDALDRLREQHDVRVLASDRTPTRAELLDAVANADALLCMLTDQVDRQLLDAAPRLRTIANYAIGSDNVDKRETASRGISVGVTPDTLTAATADLALALLLAVGRRIPEAAADVRAGRWRTWEPEGWLGLSLDGARLVVVGPGRIGRAVADRAAGFGMRTTFVGRGDDLHAALATADAVSLHAPLTDATRHLINADALRAMPEHAVLVNTGRGGLVDQAALATALHEGSIGGAGLDVTDPEPLAPDDPLLAAPNLLVLPHIGSATRVARAQMANQAADNLLAGLAGDPLPYPASAPAAA